MCSSWYVCVSVCTACACVHVSYKCVSQTPIQNSSVLQVFELHTAQQEVGTLEVAIVCIHTRTLTHTQQVGTCVHAYRQIACTYYFRAWTLLRLELCDFCKNPMRPTHLSAFYYMHVH